MTSPANEVQALIFERLTAYPAVTAIVGDRVYDRVPNERKFPYISFSASVGTPDDAECIDGLSHVLQIDCWSRYGGGFREVNQMNDAVYRALHDYEGVIDVNALVQMRVTLVRSVRDPDGLTSHGIVQVESIVEVN
ncbi:hypothetical protein CSC94_05900 [Zhengella mangrovi]|uniref:DUF3168 domain-containing protein n=1 Tax=Zhengella mangrovi TaxID=1982044 RepID=A0A2G1QRN0_9HYPH|nr:DUF3168 domain-containing protein [Zhengella mangrovi]PHP68183.1 hypothetical protein CSC94_05900 [Zhengella mangrovi]